MPFIETKTSKEISLAAEVKMRNELGKAVEIFKGKSEKWLMLNFVGGARMSFRGTSEPECAIISVELFGKAQDAEYDAFTKAATDIVKDTLGLDPERIYVKYTEYDTWGYNGENF